MAPAKRSTDGRSRVPLLVGLAVAIAGVLVWDRWASWTTVAVSPSDVAAQDKASPDATGPAADTEADAQAGSAHPLAGLSLDKLHDTVRRPLFEKKRRPVEPPPRITAAPAPVPTLPTRVIDPNALTLLGVLTSDGSGASAIALVRRNKTGQSVRLQEGDTVDGWTIERIEAARVHIRQGDTSLALELFRRR